MFYRDRTKQTPVSKRVIDLEHAENMDALDALMLLYADAELPDPAPALFLDRKRLRAMRKRMRRVSAD